MSLGLFRSGCSGRGATGSAVVADARTGALIDDGLFVGVVKSLAINVVHVGVVAEFVVAPVSALVSGTAVTKTIIHAAIEADGSAPVTFIPGVRAATKTPIPRSP